MEIFQILKKEIEGSVQYLLAAVILSGIANMLLIEIINSAAENVANQDLNHQYFLMYLLCISVFLGTKKFVQDKSCVMVAEVIMKIRCRIGNKVRKAELQTLETVGTSPLYARLTQDAVYLTNNTMGMIYSTQALFMMFFMLLYIAYLSPIVFLFVVVGLVVGFMAYGRYFDVFNYNWASLSKIETQFFEKFSHILSGFKEIRVNHKKNKAVYKNYAKVNQQQLKVRVKTSKLYNLSFFQSQAFFFGVIALVLFIIPSFHEAHAEEILKITATLLFLLGPFETALNSISVFAAANNAAKNIIDLEQQLDKKLKSDLKKFKHKSINLNPLSFRNTVELRDLTFYYDSTNHLPTFGIGPINLTFKRGEIIFVTGSNGAGKSTFLKLLTGLYMPKKGSINIDRNDEVEGEIGTTVSVQNYHRYRELFTLLFTDFHLFDKLYGLDNINPLEVKELLREMELPEEKTAYRNRGFTNIKLSSGQKKRLALVTCILDDKDIFIFDEVAADLDPWFREVYYYRILTQLKAKNKTIFVVSHDREYWHLADRVLYLNKGQVKEMTSEERVVYQMEAKEKARAMMVVN